jgi:hypothetical protein
MSSKVPRLENFGVCGVVPPAERLKEYQEQSKGLSRRLQARFWLEVLERDSEMKDLVRNNCQPKLTTTRRSRNYCNMTVTPS